MDDAPHTLEHSLLYTALACEVCGAPPEPLVRHLTDSGRDFRAFLACVRESRLLSDTQHRALERLVHDALAQNAHDSQRAAQFLGMDPGALGALRQRMRNSAGLETKPGTPPTDTQTADSKQTRPGTPWLQEAEVLPPVLREQPGRYVEMGELGKGGIGRVLVVLDSALRRKVAFKQLLPEEVVGRGSSLFRSTSSAALRFLQEAAITAQMEHPAIVPVYEIGRRDDGSIYYTMKLVHGRTFSEAIDGAKTVEQRLALLPHFVALCQAIAYAHSLGIIHRDIKPQNVIIGAYGETVVIDWGLAKARGQQDVHARGLSETLSVMQAGDALRHAQTMYGATVGTPAYIPPEQARGEIDRIDERSDVFGLGAVLYNLLSGRAPYEGHSLEEVLVRARNADFEPLEKLRLPIPPELMAICGRAMRANHQERYQSAGDLAEEVSRFLSGALVQSYQYGPGAHLLRFLRRQRAAVATAAVALLALAVFGAYSISRVVNERDFARAAQSQAENASRRAQTSQREAETARDGAEASAAAAERERERADRELYLSNISLTHSYIESGQYGNAAQTLHAAEEKHRNWEWGWLLAQSNEDLATYTPHFEPLGTSLFYSVDFVHHRIARRIGEPHQPIHIAIEELESGFPLRTTAVDGVNLYGGAYPRWSPDGRWLAVCSVDRFCIFDPDGGNYSDIVSTWVSHDLRIAISGDGRRVVYVSPDFRLTVAEVTLGTAPALQILGAWPMIPMPQRLALNHNGTLVSMAGQSTAGGAMEVHLFDVEQGRPTCTITDLAVSAHAYERTARHVWTARTSPSRLICYDAGTGTVVRELATVGEVTVLALSADDRMLVCGNTDGSIERFDLAQGATLPALRAHLGPVTAVALAANGALLASGGADRKLAVWEAAGQRLLRRFSGHADAISEIAIADDARLVASGNTRECKIWNLDAAESPLRVRRPEAVSIARPKGATALVLALERGGRIEVSPYAARAEGEAGTEDPARRLLSPDGNRMLRLDTQGAVLHEMSRGRSVELLKGDLKLASAAFSSDGDALALLVADSRNLQATLHYFHDGRALNTTIIRDFPSSDALLFAQVLATGHAEAPWAVLSDKRLILLREDAPEPVQEFGLALAMRLQQDTGAAVSPHAEDAQTGTPLCLAYATAQNEIALVKVTQNTTTLRLSGHTAPATALCFNPDGTRLVSGAANGEVRLWDVETGRLILPLPEAGGMVRQAIWPGDGDVISLLVKEQGCVSYRAFPIAPARYPGAPQLDMSARIEAFKAEEPLRRTAFGAAQAALRQIAAMKRHAAIAGGLRPGDAMDWNMLEDRAAAAVSAADRELIALGAAGEAPIHPVHGVLRNDAYLYELDALLSDHAAADRAAVQRLAAAELSGIYGGDLFAAEQRFANWASAPPYLHGAALCLAETLPPEKIAPNPHYTLLLARSARAIGNYERAIQYYRLQPSFTLGAEKALACLGTGRPDDLSHALDALLYHVRYHAPDDELRAAMAQIAARPEAAADARWMEINRLYKEALSGQAQLAWREDLGQSLAEAAESRKPVLLQVYQTRSAARTAALDLGDRPWIVRQIEERSIPCRLILEELPETDRIALRNRYGLYRPPVLLVLDTAGGIIEREDRPEHMLADRADDMVRAWNQTWLREWRILGPFPGDGKFARVLPPEEAMTGAPPLLDLSRDYASESASLAWRTVYAKDPTGQVHLDRYLAPPEQGICYAYAEIDVASEVSVDVELRFSGAANLFINGASQAHDGIRTNTPWFMPAHFSPGRHSFLVKIRQDRAASFSLWIHDRQDCDTPLPITPAPLPDCPEIPPLPPPAMHVAAAAPTSSDAAETESNRMAMELVWKEFRDEFRANPLLLVARLNLRPVLDAAGTLYGITSAHFSEVPLFSKLGLQDHDVIIQLEDRYPREFFNLDSRGNLQLAPTAINDTSGTFDKRASYTARILRDGREIELVYTMLY